jgi:hypothetical protein
MPKAVLLCANMEIFDPPHKEILDSDYWANRKHTVMKKKRLKNRKHGKPTPT